MDDTLSKPDRRNWMISQRADSDRLYAVALIDVSFRSGDPSLSLGAASGEKNEFVFSMAPKSLDLEEPAAVTITPTQDGQFVEHQGNIFKNITISGTTGLRPNRRIGSVTADIDQTTGLPRGEKSGFDDLIDLRNIFRTYFDRKADPGKSHRTLMVWQNGKEGEFYIVEPLTFRSRRDAGSPLTTTYEIQLKTIGRVDFKQFRISDSRPKREGIQRFIETMNEITRGGSRAFATLQGKIDRTVGFGQATLNTVLGPWKSVLDGLTGVITTGSRALSIPRNSIAVLAGSAYEFMESINRTQGELNAYKQNGTLTQLAVVSHAHKEIGRYATRLVATDALFSPSLSSKYDARTKAYNDPATGKSPRTGGSPTDLQNVSASNATKLATIMGHDNIFSLAQRLLGDQARWKELVQVNNLRAPYIDPSGDGITVLRPQDKVLFPVSGDEVVSGVSTSLKTTEDALVARLGRDLRLRSDTAAGGVTLLDLGTNNRGDLERVEGMPNLEQAVEIKFSTEQGELPTHPDFGLQVPIGGKALIRTLVGYQLNARASLLADSRISNVRELRFGVEGNALRVTAGLQIADIDESVGISFDARR